MGRIFSVVWYFALIEAAHRAELILDIDLNFVDQVSFGIGFVVLFPGVMNAAGGEINDVVGFRVNRVDVLIGLELCDMDGCLSAGFFNVQLAADDPLRSRATVHFEVDGFKRRREIRVGDAVAQSKSIEALEPR